MCCFYWEKRSILFLALQEHRIDPFSTVRTEILYVLFTKAYLSSLCNADDWWVPEDIECLAPADRLLL